MKIGDLGTVLTEGIVHIEDLSEDEFLQAIKTLNSWEISEKIDGAALQFGFDEEGFFTSRENKGGELRIRDSHLWGNRFAHTGFRSAHDALRILMTPLYRQGVIKTGDIFSVEILFGKLPNAIPYSGELNQIILLNKDSEPDIQKSRRSIERINKILEDRKVTVVTTDAPYTEDGLTISYHDEVHDWVVAVVPKKRADDLSTEEAQLIIDEKVSQIEKILDSIVDLGATNLPAKEVLAIPLNKKPEWLGDANWQEIKAIVKEKQQEIKERIYKTKLEIKDQLLSAFVHEQQSEFGPELENGGWIEGVVAKDPSGRLTKIVDKKGFTSINKYNWLVRSDIYDHQNSEAIVTQMRRVVADAMGHSPLAGTTAKSYIKKFGNTPEEQVQNLASDIDFDKVRHVFIQEVIQAGRKLTTKLNHFKNKTGPYENINYPEGVFERTLQTFAETHELLNEYYQALNSATTPEDLIVIFVGDKLSGSNTNNIMEGGHALEGTGAIHIQEIPGVLKKISKISGIPFSDIRNNLLGSVGKSKFSGDIDIALDDALYDKKDIILKLKKAQYNPKISTVVSFPIDIPNYDESLNDQTQKPRTGKVQVDFMFGKPDLLKFGYHSAGDKSKYKGLFRTILISSVASAMSQVFYDDNNKEIIGRFGPAFAPASGLNIRAKIRPRKPLSKKDKKAGKTELDMPRQKGERLVDFETFKKEFPSVDIGQYGERWTIDDPDDIAQFLFGDVDPDIRAKDLDSVETILPLVRKKSPELQNIVLSKFKERLERDNLELPPELINWRSG